MNRLLYIFTMIAFCTSQEALSQSNLWTLLPQKSIAEKAFQEPINANKFLLYRLNDEELEPILEEAPLWHTEAAEKSEVRVSIPLPDGQFEQFRIVEAPVMHPNLAKKYPGIKSYAGFGIDEPTAYLRFSISPSGLNAIILSAKRGAIFISSISPDSEAGYVVFEMKDYQSPLSLNCYVDETGDTKEPSTFGSEKAGDCRLREYPIAIAATGEYSQARGGTVGSVLAAINAVMTTVNAVYERDASIHFDLVDDNDQIIFLNPNTDGYDNGNLSQMIEVNETIITGEIGTQAYAVGHVFGIGGGGLARVGGICFETIKARGASGHVASPADPYNAYVTCHELGHQFGARHTMNSPCPGADGNPNRHDPSAFEPGSGSTIMSYAGVCTPSVQNTADLYFHAISLQQIGNTVTSGIGCSTPSTITNRPDVNAGADFTIPRSTPFLLTATATDQNGDLIAYAWEQMDNQLATMPPLPNNATGPMFRSMPPSASPQRYFPNLFDIVSNGSPTWEVLPSVARALNFRVTARDQHAGGGCTDEDNMVVTVAGNSGPFQVTTPNTAVNWTVGSQREITWAVANSNLPPVNCGSVDILLSLDGGFTYPIALASLTPNDGSHTVTIPASLTNQARIMVRSSGNIFFDISDMNFRIIECNATINPNIVNASCPNTSDGSVSVTLANAPPPLTFLWENGTTSPNRFNLAPGGYNSTITYNQGGCTIFLTVTIQATPDTKPPVLVCKNISIDPDANGNAAITVNQVIASLTDNCPGVTAAATPTTFDCYHAGPNIVTVTATDVGNNKATCKAIVTVTHDDDCDRVGNACDLCPGGDDKVDNNGDGKPDCKFFPGFDKLIPAWKCGNNANKVLICHFPGGNLANFETNCVSPNALPAHLGPNDYIGPCGNAACPYPAIQPLMSPGSVFDFFATAEAEGVQLKWFNDSQTSNDYFVVEKSIDAVHFDSLLRQEGNGATDLLQSYHDMDPNPAIGDNYYRLKLVYQDGSIEYSEVRVVLFNPESDFTIFPNPAGDWVTVYLDRFIGKEDVDVVISNSLGVVMYKEHLEEVKDKILPIRLDRGRFTDGIYSVSVVYLGRAHSKRMVVARN